MPLAILKQSILYGKALNTEQASYATSLSVSLKSVFDVGSKDDFW